MFPSDGCRSPKTHMHTVVVFVGFLTTVNKDNIIHVHITTKVRCTMRALSGGFRVSLNTPDEHCTCQTRIPSSVGFIILALPILAPWELFVVFWLTLGSMAPNYSRKPLMRSSKAHSIKKKGMFNPIPATPPEPGLRATLDGVFRHFRGFPSPSCMGQKHQLTYLTSGLKIGGPELASKLDFSNGVAGEFS